MKKIALIGALLAVLASCGRQNDNKIEKQIITYQKQVVTLNRKITDLQQNLDTQKNEAQTVGGRKVSVRTQEIEPRIFRHFFEASAELESIHEAFISPEVSGQVVKVLVNEGQYVEKGQLLAQLETDMVENSIREVKTSLELASFTYKKQNALWEKHIGSELQYLQAKTQMESLQNKLQSLQTQYDKSFIKSPIKGYVEAIDLKKGELAIPGVRFIHVVNLEKLYVNAQISESYLPVLHKGDSVDIRFPAFPKIHMRKPIHRIGNVINNTSRSIEVQLIINNPKQVLKPNLLARLRINDYTNPKAIVVPSYVLREDIQGYYLYVAVKKQSHLIAQKRYVKEGKSSQNLTEILEGLKAGETIITQGFNNVLDGSPLSVFK